MRRWFGLGLIMVFLLGLMVSGCRKKGVDDEVEAALEQAEQATAAGAVQDTESAPTQGLPMPGSKGR